MSCDRCGGAMTRGFDRVVYVICMMCGHEPSRATRDPQYADELRAEATYLHERRGSGNFGPRLITSADERAIAALLEGS